MAEYGIEISDGSSRDGGGSTTIKASTLGIALDAAALWVSDGDYAHGTPGAVVSYTVTDFSTGQEYRRQYALTEDDCYGRDD
jgi:hypothetical protein